MKWTLEPIGNVNRCDFVILPKEIAVGCTMSAESFDRLFYSNVPQSKNNADAYERTEQMHEEFFGRRKYSDLSSFKSAKTKRLK